MNIDSILISDIERGYHIVTNFLSRDDMGEVFSGDQSRQLQSVQCQLVCCNNWMEPAVPNMEVKNTYYLLRFFWILTHDLHSIRFYHMTFVQSDFVT